MFKEFRKFIARGNVMDLAVGVIVGGAFSKIVSSLVDDVLMPLIGVAIGGIDFSTLSITIGGASIKYGMFIQNVIDFLIIAFCIFLIVKFMNKLSDIAKKEEEKRLKAKGIKTEEVKEEIVVTEDIQLLREINASLKKLAKETKKKGK